MAGGYPIGHTALGQENGNSGLLDAELSPQSMVTVHLLLFRAPLRPHFLFGEVRGSNRDLGGGRDGSRDQGVLENERNA